MKIHHLTLILFLLALDTLPAMSQERPGCFQRKPSGEYEQLDHLCVQPAPPSEPSPPPEIGFNAQIIEGVELSGLSIQNEGNQRFLVGYITNKTPSQVVIYSIDIQFVGVNNNIVITAETFKMNNTKLMPDQIREFRSELDDIMSLGGRRNDEMKIEFTGWTPGPR